MIKSPQDAGAGVFLLAIAGLAFWLGSDLPVGSLRQLGPGMFPRVLAVLVGIVGAIILLDAMLEQGAGLGRWPLRAPLFVLGAAIAFGFAIRPLGLVVAAPLVMVIGAYASPETRWREVLIFGGAMTVFCVGLFKLALGLPIPMAPWLVGY
ncbi:MAG: tripartite tricarboxylate transporter TctB family protein [Alphaproteobacteria bacterium]|nr:tripartite tricarboxylate transporter TctB family protein [Alphaproteobacteria bacterium]